MNRPLRRGLTALTSLTVATAGLAVLGVSTATPARAAEVSVTDATFTWGLNGYAQRGIFGPWTYHDLTGNVSQLTGSVSGGDQTEYVVDPIPATSMPASDPQKSANAVKFTLGTGTADPATGEASVSWDGSYTVNAYPPQFNAPDEIYSDPELEIAPDGSGEVTMNFALGEGVDMEGNPVPAADFGRVTLMTFSAGSADQVGPDGFRYTPDYQGVEVTVPDGAAQDRSCTTAGGATGWWGSWPEEFVTVVPASVRPHFYSTGCSGMQDNKPPLPVDVAFGTTAEAPEVTVSDTTLLPNGTQQVTVTGAGFDPSLAIGTRPPFAGQQSGVYIAFGRYADVWQPSGGADSSTRTNPAAPNGNGVAVKWAVPAASFAASSPAQDPASPSYTELGADGSFSTTISVDQSWLAGAAGNFGIYTYAGGGPTVESYETYTPITFAKATPTLSITAPAKRFGQAATAVVRVASDGGSAGSVTLRRGTTTVGTKPLAGGAATFSLGKPGAGSHRLTATYTGTANIAAGSRTATLHVSKATTRTAVKIAKKPTRKKAGRVQVTVSSPTTTPAGKARVQVKKGAKVVRNAQATLRGGKATVKVSKLPQGKYQVVVTYAGNAHVAGSAKKVSFKVG